VSVESPRESGKGHVLVKVLILCSNSSKTSLDLGLGGIDGRGHHSPKPKLISNIKRQCRIYPQSASIVHLGAGKGEHAPKTRALSCSAVMVEGVAGVVGAEIVEAAANSCGEGGTWVVVPLVAYATDDAHFCPFACAPLRPFVGGAGAVAVVPEGRPILEEVLVVKLRIWLGEMDGKVREGKEQVSNARGGRC